MIDFLKWLLALFAPKTESKQSETVVKRTLAWGNKVSPEFREKVFEISPLVQIEPDHIMSVIAFESGESFSPSVRNGAGSGATGLIQFMPATARGLGTTVEALAAMTAVEQLEWVRTYFKPYTGRLMTLSDVYMAVLWPKGIGKPENYVLWNRATHPTTYKQNRGLDANGDGAITKAEAAAKVAEKLHKGRSAKYLWVEP